MIPHVLDGRRTTANALLACAVVEAAFALYVTTVGTTISTQDAGQQAFWALVSLVLLFATWRGSRGAWVALLGLYSFGVVLFVGALLFHLMSGSLPGAAYVIGAALLQGLAVALLLRPQVRMHVRRSAVDAEMRES